MTIPSLAARYVAAAAARPDVVGVVPLADEPRRNFDAHTLLILLAQLRQRHPQARLRVFVNPDSEDSRALMRTALPDGCEWYGFTDLRDLVDQYMRLRAWYGTDTGLFHMAAAIGVPATVFFGPTQPYKVVMPGETDVAAIRMQVLGQTHCEQKACTRPRCLHQAVAEYCAAAGPTPLEQTPADCPLRTLEAAVPAELPARATA
jgi:ADP-heptose:LPS heptosyltransferase